MATLYGVNATKRISSVPTVKIQANVERGVIRAAYDEIELTADAASADKIIMGMLPKGARVVNYWLAFDDLDGSGGTLDMGYEKWDPLSTLTADPDAFLADVDVTSAGILDMAEQAIVGPVGGAGPGAGMVASEDLNITITFDGDTDATSGTIKACVMYVID